MVSGLASNEGADASFRNEHRADRMMCTGVVPGEFIEEVFAADFEQWDGAEQPSDLQGALRSEAWQQWPQVHRRWKFREREGPLSHRQLSLELA